MSEVKTTDKERLQVWKKENNMEVFNIDQISALFMQLEDRLNAIGYIASND